MKKICVYLGANFGSDPIYAETIKKLAVEIAAKKLHLVYGGSSLGLMGILASTVLSDGGNVTGIISEDLLSKETPMRNLTEMIVVKSLSERKKLMMDTADGFIVFPGGIGTLEEAFDTINAIKIGNLNKKIAFLNINGYFDMLFSFMNHCSTQGLIKSKDLNILNVDSDLKNLVSTLFI